MRIRSSAILAFLLAFALCVTHDNANAATTYYVAPSSSGGSDANPGTISQPFLTINHALTQASVPDTILLRQGAHAPFHINNETGASGYLLIKPYTGEVATITTPYSYPNYAIEHAVLIENSQRVKIEDLIITGAQKGIEVRNSNSVLVVSNEIHTVGQEGVAFRRNTYNSGAYGNDIHDFGKQNPQYGEGIYVGTGSYDAQSGNDVYYPDTTHHITIQLNHIYNDGSPSAEGINVKGEADYVTVDQNTIHNLQVVTGGAIVFDNPSPSPLDGSLHNPNVKRNHVVSYNEIYNIADYSPYHDANGIMTRGPAINAHHNTINNVVCFGAIFTNTNPAMQNQTSNWHHNTATNAWDGEVWIINGATVDTTP